MDSESTGYPPPFINGISFMIPIPGIFVLNIGEQCAEKKSERSTNFLILIIKRNPTV